MSRKRIVTWILAMAILLVSEFQQIEAFDAKELKNSNMPWEGRLVEVFEKQIELMCQLEEESTGKPADELRILSIERISDFEGNEYTLVECAPTGYMIYHNESGVFVEYSPVTNSAYYNTTGERKYVGPNAYYISEERKKYRDILRDEKLNASQVERLKNSSEKINDKLSENKNADIINYVEGNTDFGLAEIYGDSITYASTRTVTEGEWKYVNGYEFFANLNQCGYIGGGKCGYIAAAMLLTYDEVVNGIDTVPNGWYEQISEKEYQIDPAFATRLYNMGVESGHGASTTSGEIHDTVNTWLARRMLTANHISLYVPTQAASKIKALINENRPVIWFGDIWDNTYSNESAGFHAIVIYGYRNVWYSNEFVAHFGWNNATKVYFTGILGSMYSYEW